MQMGLRLLSHAAANLQHPADDRPAGGAYYGPGSGAFLGAPLAAGAAAGQRHVLFPKLSHIVRDAAHTARSVQRLTWENTKAALDDILKQLVDGPKSCCRELANKRRFERTLKELQEHCIASSCGPLLAKIAARDNTDESAWANHLLADWSGGTGLEKLVGATIVADSMILDQRFSRLCDADAQEPALTAIEATKRTDLI